MSPPGRWSFWLASSSDMRSLASISSPSRQGRPPSGSMTDAKLTGLGRNMPGQFSCSLPMDCDAAIIAQNHATCVRAERRSSVSGEVSTKWSGFVQSIGPTDIDKGTTQISAIGWFEELNNRKIRFDEAASGRLNFVDEIGGEIARELLTVANEQVDSSGTQRPTHLRFGTRSDTQVRTVRYEFGASFGASIDALSQIENGFDWEVDPLHRTLSTRSPDDYEERPEVSFVHGLNCSVTAREDGTLRRNRITVTGAGGVVVVRDDPQAISAAGGQIIDEHVSLQGVADVVTMQAYADAELAYSANSSIVLSVRPWSLGDVPRLYDDFNLGDLVLVTARGGRVNLDHQPVRVFSANLSFTKQLDEVVDEMTVALS